MLSSFTDRFRPFVWCTIVLFTLSSIPHIDIALRSAAVFLPSTAHAEEIETRGSEPQTGDSPYSAASRAGENHDMPVNSDRLENESDEMPEDTADRSVSTSSTTAAAGGADKTMGVSLPVVDSMIFTGAATARIPINVPPGRLGIAPNIAFLYNSYRGNGPLGVGWDIDLGAIQRATKKGVSYSNNDYVAMINGSTSDLVPRSDWGANYYGARIEGVMSKLYYNSSTGGWEVTTKEGTKYYYGSSSASRQDFSGGYVFKWCLDKVQDTNGNTMTVTYMKNQGQIYPSKITYAGNTGVVASHSVLFNWVTGRNDVLPMVMTNFPVKTAYQLSSVAVYSGSTLQRKYVTQYTTSTTSNRLLLTSVTEYGKNGGALPPTSFTWQQGTNDWEAFSGIQDDLCPNEDYSDAHTYPMVIGDFNGDARTEVGRVAVPGVSFYQPTDSGWQVMPFLSDYGTNQGYSDANTYPLLIGDFNGDGKTEVGRTGWSGTNFYQLTGAGWQMSSSFSDFGTGQGYSSANTYPVIVGDFDGDGRSDVGRVGWTGVSFYRLTDSGWQAMAFLADYGTNRGYSNASSYPLLIGDFNGDGKTEVGRIGMSGTNFYQLTGSGWQMMSCLNDFGRNQGYAGDNPLLIGDFNGDGRTDVGRVHENGTKFYQQTQSGWQFMGSISDFGEREECPVPNPACAVFINENRLPFFIGDFNGDGRTDVGRVHKDGANFYQFTSSGWQLMDSFDGYGPDQGYIDADRYPLAVGDFNGDGRTDIGRVWWSGVGFLANSSPSPDLMNTVTSPLGSVSTLYYTPSSRYSNTLLPFVLQTLYYLYNDDGRGNVSGTSYYLSGGLYKHAERDFGGFGYTVATRWNSVPTEESHTETWFHQDDILKGNISVQIVTSREGHTRRIDNTWTAYALGYGAYHARLNRAGPTVTDYGSTPYSTYTDYEYDLSLNIKRELKVGLTSEEEVDTRIVYSSFGKPTDVAIKDSSGAIVSRKWMDYDAKGNLLTEEVCKSDTPATGCINRNDTQNAVTEYAYTPEGNVETITDPLGGLTTFTYDSTKTYVYRKTNPLGHVTTTEYDPGIGKLKKMVPPHLQGTAFALTREYDEFGRPTREDRPDGGQTSYEYRSLGSPGTQNVLKTERIAGDSSYLYHNVKDYFDGLGRVYWTAADGPTAESPPIITVTYFDALGRVQKKSNPYYRTDSPPYTTFTYDGLSGVVDTLTPDGYHILTSYKGLQKTVTDQNNHATVYTSDVYGRLKKVKDPEGTVTQYSYDNRGNLTRVVAAQGKTEQNTTTMTYDSMSKKRTMNDPDMGSWSYQYDKAGNLISQTDAIGKAIDFDYDPLNRIIRKNYLTFSGTIDYTVTYTYDDPAIPYSTGMLTKVSDPSGGESKEDSVLEFDLMQRAILSQKQVGSTTKTFAKTCDSAGRTLTFTYFPGGASQRAFRYNYDLAGNITSLQDVTNNKTVVRYSGFTALGQPGTATFPKPNTYKASPCQ